MWDAKILANNPIKATPLLRRCPLSTPGSKQQQKLTFEQRQISHESCGSFIAHLILFLVIDGVLKCLMDGQRVVVVGPASQSTNWPGAAEWCSIFASAVCVSHREAVRELRLIIMRDGRILLDSSWRKSLRKYSKNVCAKFREFKENILKRNCCLWFSFQEECFGVDIRKHVCDSQLNPRVHSFCIERSSEFRLTPGFSRLDKLLNSRKKLIKLTTWHPACTKSTESRWERLESPSCSCEGRLRPASWL